MHGLVAKKAWEMLVVGLGQHVSFLVIVVKAGMVLGVTHGMDVPVPANLSSSEKVPVSALFWHLIKRKGMWICGLKSLGMSEVECIPFLKDMAGYHSWIWFIFFFFFLSCCKPLWCPFQCPPWGFKNRGENGLVSFGGTVPSARRSHSLAN